MAEQKQILVVGAGVVGLTTALVLAQKLANSKIHLVSKDLPSDPDADLYTSPKAGAHWSSENSKENKDWQLLTYRKLQELSKVPEAFVTPKMLYQGDIIPKGKPVPEFEVPWFAHDVEGYQFLGTDPRFPDIHNLYVFQSYTISTSYYLTWLLGQLRGLGVSIQRHTIKSLKEAKQYDLGNGSKPDLVINCTGLGFQFLEDGHDPKLKPVKGHTMMIENNLPYQVYFEQPYPPPEANPGEFLMLFPRAEGGSILGGIYNQDFEPYDTSLDQAYVKRVIDNVKHHLPELLNENGQLKISKHVVGFRPQRDGGARIEFEGNVLHNYGCGNSGYIESYGCAERCLELIKDKLSVKPKL